MNKVPKISIVIPTYNSDHTLEVCLKSVFDNITPYKFEVIVVDAGSTDETLEIAKKFPCVVLKGKPRHINRNAGIQAATGDIICFTDSDCKVPSYWIDSLVHNLIELNRNDDKVAGVGGANVPMPTKNIIAKSIVQAMRSPLIAFNARNVAVYPAKQPVEHNPPVNSCYFKTVLDAVGGFIEKPGYPEDTDLDFRIRKAGYKLYYIPKLEVQHKHKTTVKEYCSQMYDFGQKRIRGNRANRGMGKLMHYGPLVLHLMLMLAPFNLIPIAMAGLNALMARNMRLFPLTLNFYNYYGQGELDAIMEGRKS